MPWTPDEGDVLYGSRDEYELLEYVDTGGFTTVFRSRERTNGDIVAVKYPNFSSVNENVDRNVEREVRTLRSIEAVGGHPNIMTLREHFVMRGTDILVVEFVDGTDLADSDQTESLETVRNIGLTVCDALSLLHANGLVYRDLSGGNLLLTPSHDPMLIDFNMVEQVTRCQDCGALARAGAGRAESCPNCGSLFPETSCFSPTESSPYRAPEQFDVNFPIGPWMDVYAVGKLLYYLVEGYARRGEGIDPTEDNEACPAYLGRIVERATAREPRDRYASAAHLGQALWECDPDPGPVAGVLENVRTGARSRVTDGTTIGRDGDTTGGTDDPPLLSDPPQTVSRHHLRMHRKQWCWRVEDVSRNGTYIRRNDQYHSLGPAHPGVADDGADRSATSRTLHTGDVISLVDPISGPTLRFATNEWGVR